MDARDISIIGQVAAKEASNLATAVAEENSVSVLQAWDAAFEHVYTKLIEDIVVQQTAHAFTPTSNAGGGGSSNTSNSSGGPVRVKGDQHGDLPDWLVEAAERAGVTEVWDNRNEVAGTRKPHFKQVLPKGSDPTKAVAFWPPK